MAKLNLSIRPLCSTVLYCTVLYISLWRSSIFLEDNVIRNLMEGGSYLKVLDLFGAHPFHSLTTRYFSVFSGCFPVLTRGPFFLFFLLWMRSIWVMCYVCRSPDRLRRWGPYPLACLLFPYAILCCSSSINININTFR